MTQWIGFVRNVMVGRQGLTRDVLITAFLDAGAEQPTSHLTTGNVAFTSTGSPEAIGRQVQDALAQVLGRSEPVFLRSVETLRRQMAAHPFSQSPFADVHERCVSFTTSPIDGLDLPLTTARGDAVAFDVDRITGAADVYSVTRLVGGRPGTIGGVLERTLGRPVTTRNWNTIERITAKV